MHIVIYLGISITQRVCHVDRSFVTDLMRSVHGFSDVFHARRVRERASRFLGKTRMLRRNDKKA